MAGRQQGWAVSCVGDEGGGPSLQVLVKGHRGQDEVRRPPNRREGRDMGVIEAEGGHGGEAQS